MERIDAIDAALARTAAALEEIGPDDLRRPTACADWDLGRLLLAFVGR